MSHWSLLKKKWESTYMVACMIFLLPFCHASPDNVGPSKRQKVQKFLIQKVKKILFTDYCSLTLFTFTVHDTVHSEILPI